MLGARVPDTKLLTPLPKHTQDLRKSFRKIPFPFIVLSQGQIGLRPFEILAVLFQVGLAFS